VELREFTRLISQAGLGVLQCSSVLLQLLPDLGQLGSRSSTAAYRPGYCFATITAVVATIAKPTRKTGSVMGSFASMRSLVRPLAPVMYQRYTAGTKTATSQSGSRGYAQRN
jgi:hypothetical protein